jgi:hypothetical protein
VLFTKWQKGARLMHDGRSIHADPKAMATF